MNVTEWLLDSDPAIRWHVMRDLTDEPADVVSAERTRVAAEGWGAAVLARQDPGGTWDGDVFSPPWTSSLNSLQLLRDLGVDPAGAETRRAIELVVANVHWQEWFDSNPFFEGEEEACINGRVLALGAYFGHPSERLRDLLISQRFEDGGWNCYAPPSVRSSFNSTICVLEGLLDYENQVGGSSELSEARRGLDYFRDAGAVPDDRFAEAIRLIESKRGADGRWPLERTHEGKEWFVMEQVGSPSRWITLRALRVLRWYRS
jgi:hypothetical protein